MTNILPACGSDSLLLCFDESGDGTHAIFLLRTTFDTCQWYHTVIDNNSNLGIWDRGAGENYTKVKALTAQRGDCQQ